jgi:phosphonate transport system substrate-binding protein
MSVQDIYHVLSEVDLETIAVEDYAASGMEYLLLVNASSPYRRIEDLKKTRLIYQQHRDNILMMPWIEIMLAEAHQPPGAPFFESVETRAKINEVILPLFFHKANAVALTRRAFNLAVEMNPQLGRDLRVLATSPKLIVDAFGFHRGCDPEDKRAIFNALKSIGTVPAGRQLLTLYESSGFVLKPGSALNGALDLVRQYERIKR